ncbi:hypothetical protein RIF29_18829 [Crotalaria pallida]|uniref:PGG domain-containing protein n=1 Tax=Crotalaria pallida TaxID=3830 RepID=A0AAN9EYV4_CROPI
MSTMNNAIINQLNDAAKEGNIDLLYTVIQEEPDVLEHLDVKPFAETPLHVAVSAGQLQFAIEILRLKPSFAWKPNQQGFSPIHLALQLGHTRMVHRFIDIDKDMVRVKGREGITPLHFASRNGDIELLTKFLSACPDSIQDVTIRSETALHIAVQNYQYDTLKFLLRWLEKNFRKGAAQLEKTILDSKDEAGNTILHISTLLNDSQALGLLINTKIDLKAKNLENLTALDIASSAEIKDALQEGGPKRILSSFLSIYLPFKHKLLQKIGFYTLIIAISRMRANLSKEHRNTLLVVTTLIASATYLIGLNPPGGFYAGDSIRNNTAAMQGKAGKSVLSGKDFFYITVFNMITFYMATTAIILITPCSGKISHMLSSFPITLLASCYNYTAKMMSPTSSTKHFSSAMFLIFIFITLVVSPPHDNALKETSR